jgi:hypothetical protein
MRHFLVALGGVVVLGVVVAIAWGYEALWLYGFVAALAIMTAVLGGLGGGLIEQWSRRRFDDGGRRPDERY